LQTAFGEYPNKSGRFGLELKNGSIENFSLNFPSLSAHTGLLLGVFSQLFQPPAFVSGCPKAGRAEFARVVALFEKSLDYYTDFPEGET
jgi:hypothetical protein